MQRNITLKKNGQVDGQERYFHNNTDINVWKASDKVDSTQKIFLNLVELYTHESNKNKKPEERLYTQNTYLSKVTDHKGNILREYKTITVQRALDYLLDMGVIKYFLYLDKEGNTYKWTGGTREEWLASNAGLTERRIVLDINRAKELLTITHKSDTFKEAQGKGRLRRLVYRRPFSLKGYADELTDLQKQDNAKAVKELNDKKNTSYDPYLILQFKKFNDFTEVVVSTVNTEEDTIDDEIKTMLHNFIYMKPLDTGITS